MDASTSIDTCVWCCMESNAIAIAMSVTRLCHFIIILSERVVRSVVTDSLCTVKSTSM